MCIERDRRRRIPLEEVVRIKEAGNLLDEYMWLEEISHNIDTGLFASCVMCMCMFAW